MQIWMKNVSQTLDLMRKSKDQPTANKQKVEVEYESNAPYCSEKLIPCPPQVAETIKGGIMGKIAWFRRPLTTQQKVDIIFKLVIFIAVVNLLAVFKIFF